MILRLALLTIVAGCAWAQETAPQLSPLPPRPIELPQVRTVYLLSMSSGFDQFLANQLTRTGVFQIVTDPDRADAVMAEALGPDFEKRLSELYPAPAAVEAPPAAEDKEDSDKGDDKKAGSTTLDVKGDPTPRRSSFNRGKGNIFLVDPRSKTVIWSTYIRPRSTTPNDLNRAAESVAERLKVAAKKSTGAVSQ